jgi:hypothetical protein
VNLVGPLPAFLSGLVLFLLPGLLILACWPRQEQEKTPADEAAFWVVALSVFVSAWVALILAELGTFGLTRAAAVVLGVSLLGALVAAGRRRLGWAFPRPRLAAMIPAALLLVLALLLDARPGRYIVGGRDPGAYVAAMALIARTGAVAFEDPVVRAIPPEDLELFFRHPDRPEAFSWTRFMGFDLERPQTGRVLPQFFHLFPAFGAYLFAAMGTKGALATPAVFGVLGTLGLYFAARRLAGPRVAFLAALLLTVNVLQVWFARFPASETVSQLLMLVAFLAVARFEETRAPVFAALTSAVLGLSLLVRIDSLLVVLPLGLYLGHRLARRQLDRRTFLAFVLPFAVLAAHAAFHAAFFARKYFLQVATRRYWNLPPLLWMAVAAAGIALLALAWRLGPRIAAWAEQRDRDLRSAAALGIVLLAAYAYFVRPALSAWAGGDGNVASARLADPAWLQAFGFHRLAAHDAQAFLRLGWFVTPLGLLVGTLGFARLVREADRRWLLPLLCAATFAGFYLYKIRVWNDYFFAMRRVLPVILPVLLLGAAYLLVRMAARGRLGRIVAASAGAALVVSFAADTARIARFVDWANSVEFVRDVARRFGSADVVLFEQPKSIHLLSLPLWAHHGVNALQLARFDPDPERLNHLVRAWRGRYRNVYFVHTPRTDLCGLFLERVQPFSFGTYEWERSYERPPREARFQSLHFTLSRVVAPEDLQVPATGDVDVGGSDDVLVSGFFDKELVDGRRSYRWTGACGSVYLPGAKAGASVVLTLGTGQRPAAAPAELAVSLNGVVLGRVTPQSEFADFVLPLPTPLPPGPPVLRLDVKAWRPGLQDGRELGVMVDRIHVRDGA